MEVYKTVFFLNICVALALIFCVHETKGFWLWGNDNKDKVNGKWSQWSNYSSCQLPTDGKENFPYRFRTRKCNNPAPKAGGKSCKGQDLRKAPCSDCDWPLGIESKVIKDSMITASTSHEEFPARNARLNGPSSWCAKDLSGELFLQVDFDSLTLVTAIATQGFYPDPKELSLRLGSVSKYQITFSDDGITFEVYENSQKNKVFTGNGNNLKTVLNTFDPQIAAKHIRIHPTAYIKFVCMKFELYGCSFKCGGYLPTSPGDLLAVSSETQDVDCFWQAHSPNSSKINFDFINFNLPCKYGQVEVRGSHPFYGGSKSLGKFCDYTFAPPPIVSKGNKLWIRFQSKSPDPLVGFYGIYFSSCDTVLNSTQGTFTTPGYPKLYNHNSKCTWSINVPKGYVVMLEFLDFDIEEESDCKNDYLSVFDSNSSIIGQYCNSNKPTGLLCSSANTMRLNFRSDDVLALKGFQATYKAVPAGTPCIKPSTSIISPTPSISMSTIATDNFTVMSTAMITPTATVSLPMAGNSSLGVLQLKSGVPGAGAGNQWNKKDDDDDDEDTGMTTIIIISVFSFIVLCMIIASIVPSMIHGIEKRRKKRDWLAAADLAALKKNSVVENEYEMQPCKHHNSNKNEDMEPNEETAFLDPKNQSIEDLKETPCFAVIEKEDTTSACKDDFENCPDGPLDEDLECELEYDTTDLNLSVSCEDLGSSFATEMAALMNNYKHASSQEDDPAKPQQKEATAQEVPPEVVAGAYVSDDHKNSDQANEKPEKPCNDKENDDNDKEPQSTNHPEEFNQSNDKLQNALTGLKTTLSDHSSDSCSIPELEHPETFTNSTASVTDSQDIPSIPTVDICPAVWGKNWNDKNIPSKDSQIQDELKSNKDSSANDAEQETCV